MLANVDNFLTPIIQRLRKGGESADEKHLEILQRNVEEITSSLGLSLERQWSKLTPKEIEICNMIKNGLSAKEIARLLHASYRTIETHRHNIRRKLGLSNKKENLTSFLKTLS